MVVPALEATTPVPSRAEGGSIVKYANQTVKVWLKQDSIGPGAPDPEKAFNLFTGDTFADDHPLVIDRPELFTNEDGSPISEEQ